MENKEERAKREAEDKAEEKAANEKADAAVRLQPTTPSSPRS